MNRQLLSTNSSPILELSVKFAPQICHENINKPLDGTYSADFGINITFVLRSQALISTKDNAELGDSGSG